MRLTISSAEARRTVRYADACPQSFTLREEARSCLAALSQLSWSTLLPVIVERHLVSGYYALKLYSFHVTHPRRKALPYVRKRDAGHTLREESPYKTWDLACVLLRATTLYCQARRSRPQRVLLRAWSVSGVGGRCARMRRRAYACVQRYTCTYAMIRPRACSCNPTYQCTK